MNREQIMALVFGVALLPMIVAVFVLYYENKGRKEANNGLMDCIHRRDKNINELQCQLHRIEHSTYEKLTSQTPVEKRIHDAIQEHDKKVSMARNEAFRTASNTPYPSIVNNWLQTETNRLKEELDEKVKEIRSGKQWYTVTIHYKGIGEHNFNFFWSDSAHMQVTNYLDGISKSNEITTICDDSGNVLTIEPKEILFIKIGKVNQ